MEYNKAEWQKQKHEELDKAYEMSSAEYKRVHEKKEYMMSFLKVFLNFDEYSIRNMLLIHAQKPNAVSLHTYDDYKEKGFYVKKGVSGIKLLRSTGEFKKPDGSIGKSWTTQTMFDVLQTNAPMPKAKKSNVEIETIYRALLEDPPCKFDFYSEEEVPNLRISASYDSELKSIRVIPGSCDERSLYEALRAYVTAQLDKDGWYDDELRRPFTSYIGEMVAFLIIVRFGHDMEDILKYSLFTKSLERYQSVDNDALKWEATNYARKLYRTIRKTIVAVKQGASQ